MSKYLCMWLWVFLPVCAMEKISFVPNLAEYHDEYLNVPQSMERWGKKHLPETTSAILNIFRFKKNNPGHYMLGTGSTLCQIQDLAEGLQNVTQFNIPVKIDKNNKLSKKSSDTIGELLRGFLDMNANSHFKLVVPLHYCLRFKLVVPLDYINDLATIDGFWEVIQNDKVTSVDVIHDRIDFCALADIWRFYTGKYSCLSEHIKSCEEVVSANINHFLQVVKKSETYKGSYKLEVETACTIWDLIQKPLIENSSYMPFEESLSETEQIALPFSQQVQQRVQELNTEKGYHDLIVLHNDKHKIEKLFTVIKNLYQEKQDEIIAQVQKNSTDNNQQLEKSPQLIDQISLQSNKGKRFNYLKAVAGILATFCLFSCAIWYTNMHY